MFICNVKLTGKIVYSFCNVLQLINKFYKKDTQKYRLLKQLYTKKADISILIRYYFSDISKIDQQLEKIRNPDNMRDKESKISTSTFPRFLNNKIEHRYQVFRANQIDTAFIKLLLLYGVIFIAVEISLYQYDS